jgi:hypothetical protein
MKMFSLILGITVLTASFAQAGSIVVSPGAATPDDRGGFDVYQLVLDPTGMEGGFDTLEISTVGAINQESADNIMDLENSTDSGFSAFLTASTGFGGQGLSPFGVAGDENGLEGTYASLGSNAISEMGQYVVAQLSTQRGGAGTFSYAFFDDGQEVGRGDGSYGIPEPGTLALAALGLVGIVVRRRS